MRRAIIFGVRPSAQEISSLPFRMEFSDQSNSFFEFTVDASSCYQVPRELWGKRLHWAMPSSSKIEHSENENDELHSEGSTKRVPRVLVVGAGGIGCELLKTLLLCGIRNIEVVDMDTIDGSNLNRQFLFTLDDVGKSKSEVASQVLSDGYNAFQYTQSKESFPSVSIIAHVGNITDTSKFSKSFFEAFDVVCCGLDNVAARKHVNRMCFRSGVPLVESGTMGFNGQVQPIQFRHTECYDCHPKPSGIPSFAVCTIHARPTTMIHCVHYAKELFARLFGASGFGESDLEIDSNTRADADLLFGFIHNKKIRELATKSSSFPRGVPRPVDLKENTESVVHTLGSQFLSAFRNLQKRDGPFAFDKDDPVALDFVYSVSNLRAYIFRIELESISRIQAIAGNIVPAVATSNAIVGAMVVTQALRYLNMTLAQDPCFVHLRQFPLIRRRKFSWIPNLHLEPGRKNRCCHESYLMHSHPTGLPVPHCLTCSSHRGYASLYINTCETTLGSVVRNVLQGEMGLSDICIDLGSSTLYESGEFESLVNVHWSHWTFPKSSQPSRLPNDGNSNIVGDQIVPKNLELTITDTNQDLQWKLALFHADRLENDRMFDLLVHNDAQANASRVPNSNFHSHNSTLVEQSKNSDDVTSYHPKHAAKRSRENSHSDEPSPLTLE